MIRSQTIGFGEWLPDLAALGNPGTSHIVNAEGHEGFYSSVKGLKPFIDTALPSAPRGAIWGRSPMGDVAFFVGLENGVRVLQSDNSWRDVTPVGGVSKVTKWEFVSFGDHVIAATGKTKLLKIEVPPAVNSKFVEIPGSPKAARLAIVRDFVVAGDIASTPSKIQWSGFNNADLWESSQSTQSDFQTIHGLGGRVHRIVPGSYGLIFQANSLVYMSYVGTRVIFRLDNIEEGRGTPAPESVCWIGGRVYYYGHDDFYVFDGKTSTPLGANRIRKWFKDFIGAGTAKHIQGVVDRQNARILWGFRKLDAGEYNSNILEYNYAADKWSLLETPNINLVEYASVPIIPDDVSGGGIGNESFDDATSDWFDQPLDSPIWQGGDVSLVGFDKEFRIARFDGNALPATIETKELTGASGSLVKVNAVRPLVSGAKTGDLQVSLGWRDLENDNVIFDGYTYINPEKGFAAMGRRARFIRVRLHIAEGNGFKQAQGVTIYMNDRAGS